METFTVYDQRIPLPVGNGVNTREWSANLVKVGWVDAMNHTEAFKIAKERKLARFPVIGGKSLDAMRERNTPRRWERDER